MSEGFGITDGKDPAIEVSGDRLLHAERQGLRLAIFCRTLAVALAFIWLEIGWWLSDHAPSVWATTALVLFFAVGVLTLTFIGTSLDRWWLKYVIYAADILGICALFAMVPVSRGADVPQIIAFRAYGIYYLFPLVAMACLSLSWRLVLWSGAMVVVGWWTAFLTVISDMDRRLSWSDFETGGSRQEYEQVFLSPDFIGVGNRIEETAFVLISASILALAVYRARRVFFAQLRAEAEREAERADREQIANTLGRYVPEAIAQRLMVDRAALAPQVRDAAVLVMDIQGFTAFAANRPPEQVIDALNGFLAACVDLISNHEGVVITFTGDGLLATFNAPLEVADPEQAALQAAKALSAYADETQFRVRIGLAAGPIAAGSVGSSQRQTFTVYGDTVNRAARLETLAKDLGEVILFDERIARTGTGHAPARPLGNHKIKGFAEPISLWAPAQMEMAVR
ncbi:MAG: adenylate/guanylate cyclase domain-containing protein [Geminicoccaceae bacterium]